MLITTSNVSRQIFLSMSINIFILSDTFLRKIAQSLCLYSRVAATMYLNVAQMTSSQCWVCSEQFLILSFRWLSLHLGNPWVIFSCQCKIRHLSFHVLTLQNYLLNTDCNKDKSNTWWPKENSIHTLIYCEAFLRAMLHTYVEMHMWFL